MDTGEGIVQANGAACTHKDQEARAERHVGDVGSWPPWPGLCDSQRGIPLPSRPSQIKFSKPYLLQGEFPTAQHTPPTTSCHLPEMLLTCRSSLSFLRPAAPLLGPSFGDPSLLLPTPGLAWGSPLPTTLPPSLASRTHWVLYTVGTQRGIANPKREEVS